MESRRRPVQCGIRGRSAVGGSAGWDGGAGEREAVPEEGGLIGAIPYPIWGGDTLRGALRRTIET